MPRNIDLNDELKDLSKRSPDYRRQYVMRLLPDAASRMISDCLAQNKQPGPLLEEIITGYYSDRTKGVVLDLMTKERTFLDLIAAKRGTSREEVAASIIRSHVVETYKAELLAEAEINELLSTDQTDKGGSAKNRRS